MEVLSWLKIKKYNIFQQGNVKIGAMICYDRESPEGARILMLKAAEIILVPNACPTEINLIS
jgi:predicted amidohydrolase